MFPFRLRRGILLALLLLVTGINYLDRQTLSIVAPLLQSKISISTIDYSHVVFLFLLGYMIGQTLDGKIIDRVGSRLGMFYCVALWSIISILHGLVTGVVSLGILRFLLGVTEAGNWPGGVKTIGENFAPSERAFALGIFNSGSTLGALIAPPLVALIVVIWGWRLMFVAIGISGLIWSLLWIRFDCKKPAPTAVAAISVPPLHLPMRTLLRDKAVWILMIARFFADPLWWFYAFWLPEYLAQNRGFSLTQIGRTAWIPFVFGGAGSWLGGLVSDALIRRGVAPVTARKILILATTVLMLGGVPAFLVRSSNLALAFISIVVFGFQGWASNMLSLITDSFPGEVVGQVTGLSGTAAAIGGMLFTLATGWLIQNVSYGSVFLASSGMILCSSIVMLWLQPRMDRFEPTYG